MIIWGGSHTLNGTTLLQDGGRYDPVTDTWFPTSIGPGTPSPRWGSVGVWTGTEMFIWGGGIRGAGLNSGALYCACAAGNYYRDQDGDGLGDGSAAVCGPATGFVATPGDCDDSSIGNWAIPGEASDLQFQDALTLTWAPPASPGTIAPVRYDVIRSTLKWIAGDAACAATSIASTSFTDPTVPAPGTMLYYLVRARNGCPNGIGPLGHSSSGTLLAVPACP
jgi:hypothetical protein